MDSTSSAILNMSDLLTRVDDDRELLRELFTIFESLYPVHLERLREAVHLKDPRKLEMESHTLKGMLVNLSAKRAASVASELEQFGRAQTLETVPETLSAFESEVKVLLAQMELCASELQP
jgi:HPt (histidine-containing phosphotransfer) domain-containing protein